MANFGLKKSKNIFRSGFTIVELLVVIVIIGILVGITVVSYGSITEKAVVENLKADLGGASTQLMRFYADNGEYPAGVDNCPNTDTTKICAKYSSGNTYSYTTDGQTYTLYATNTNGKKYYINNMSSTPVAFVYTIGSATGGDIITYLDSNSQNPRTGTPYVDGYTVHTFNSSGTLSLVGGILTGVDVLIVGGGGSGEIGPCPTSGANGGQVIYLSDQTIDNSVSITVGGENQNSYFGVTSALGAGGASGGSGGSSGSNGEDGSPSSITGNNIYYGGGGGGGGYFSDGIGGLGGGGDGGVDGVNYLGGGGGGEIETEAGCSGYAGAGGSGVVIVKHPT